MMVIPGPIFPVKLALLWVKHWSRSRHALAFMSYWSEESGSKGSTLKLMSGQGVRYAHVQNCDLF